MLLLVLLAVYDALILSTVVDNVAEWVRTAPAWQGYGGEVDNSGRLVHQFGSHSSGKFTIRCDLDTNRATIRGAVQPFHQGHNSGPFPYSEALAACEAIVTALQVPASSLRVHALETGVTVPTSEAPTTFLAQLARASYGPTQRPFYAKEPPAGIRAPLQYTAVFEQYRAKIYDKGTYNRLMQKPLPPGGNGFRYELHYRKARKIAAALG